MNEETQASPSEVFLLTPEQALEKAIQALRESYDTVDTASLGGPEARGILAWCLNHLDAHKQKG